MPLVCPAKKFAQPKTITKIVRAASANVENRGITNKSHYSSKHFTNPWQSELYRECIDVWIYEWTRWAKSDISIDQISCVKN